MSTSKKYSIELPENVFKVLAHWASIDRTIKEAIDCLVELDTEQSQYTAEELSHLAYALNYVNMQCKEVKAQIEYNEYNKKRGI